MNLEPEITGSSVESIPKQLQLKNYISQHDLAECLGITSQTLGKQLRDLRVSTIRFGRTALIRNTDTRTVLENRGFVFPNLVIAVQMLKGGSGKTTSCFNIAIRASQYGFRVLIIDLDMQGNITGTFGVESAKPSTIISYIRGEKTFPELIIPIEDSLHLIPSNYENSTIDIEIFSKRHDYTSLLAKPITQIRRSYDLILMDCNPSLSTLNVSAALASDIVLVPINPDTYSMDGLLKTASEIKRISEGRSKAPDLKLFYTLFDARESSSRDFLVEYANSFRKQLLETAIHRSADVRTGTITGRSVFEVPRAFTAQTDFDSLTREILGLSSHFRGTNG